METFDFDFECNVCRIGRKNRFMAFANKFDMYIENKIETFICCNQCSEMYKYEEIYSDVKYKQFNKVEKQIHCLFSFFDDDYKKLKNLKEKKKFFKQIIDRSNYCRKPLLKKFMNDTYNIKMIESFNRCLLFDYNIRYYFNYIYGEFFLDLTTYRNSYSENNLHLFKTVLEYYVEYQMRFSRN